ncbi:hypothetical protein E4U15_000545 [Claviceps sp. LM218 group G6]|nr:hypothetical protein E4U15_000545 [Claviceps sp. LM218 group G6]
MSIECQLPVNASKVLLSQLGIAGITMTLISCQISAMGAARRKYPDSAAEQAASDETTSNNTHNAQAEGDKPQL